MTWYTGRTKAGASEYGPLDCGHYDLLDTSFQGLWEESSDKPSESNKAIHSQDQLSGLYAKLHVVRTLDHENLYNISDVGDYTGAMWQLPMRTEFLRASWHLCEEVYSEVSVDLGFLSVGSVTTNSLTWLGQPYSQNYNNIFHSNASGLNYTVAAGLDGEADNGVLSQVLNSHLGYSPDIFMLNPTFNSSDSNKIFHSIMGELGGPPFIQSLLEVPVLTKSLSIYLRSADIEALTHNLASTLTARIRSNTAGGNANLTMFPGQAFVKEVYIAVQWPWMILPITETVLAAAALAITIVLTRQQALLKGSTVSLLMHQIDGWSPEETRVRRLDTSEQLRDRAKKMVVRLDEGQDGKMVFKR